MNHERSGKGMDKKVLFIGIIAFFGILLLLWIIPNSNFDRYINLSMESPETAEQSSRWIDHFEIGDQDSLLFFDDFAIRFSNESNSPHYYIALLDKSRLDSLSILPNYFINPNWLVLDREDYKTSLNQTGVINQNPFKIPVKSADSLFIEAYQQESPSMIVWIVNGDSISLSF